MGIILRILIVVCALWVAGCKDNAEPLAVDIQVDHQVTPQGLVFDLKTNLPNGMKVVVFLQSGFGDSLGASNVIIESGKASTEVFSRGGEPHLAGDYVLKVVAHGHPQSKVVASVIGDRGSNLSGSLVIHDATGKIAKYKYPFSIGTPEQKQQVNRDALVKVKRLAAIVKRVSGSVESLRSSYSGLSGSEQGAWLANWNREAQQWKSSTLKAMDWQSESLCKNTFFKTETLVTEMTLLGIKYVGEDDGVVDQGHADMDKRVQEARDSLLECAQRFSA